MTLGGGSEKTTEDKLRVLFGKHPQRASQSSKVNEAVARPKRTTNINAEILPLMFVTVVSSIYSAIIWALTLSAVDLVVFASAFCAAIACSILLGILISRRN